MPRENTPRTPKKQPAAMANPSDLSIFSGLMDEVDKEVERLRKLEEEAEKEAQKRA